MFSENLRYYRQQKNLSEGALALQVHLPKKAIRLLESGERKPTTEDIRLLARALEVKVQDLVADREGDPDAGYDSAAVLSDRIPADGTVGENLSMSSIQGVDIELLQLQAKTMVIWKARTICLMTLTMGNRTVPMILALCPSKCYRLA